MWMLVSSQPARNASNPTTEDGAAEPVEGCAELGIGDSGEPLVERHDLACVKRDDTRPARLRIDRERTLHQGQSVDHGTAKKQVHALDQQWRSVLEL
jgi:hypothetical protein